MNERFTNASRSGISLVAAALAAILAVGLAAPAEVAAQKSGGTLRVAIIGEPPSIDPHVTTATINEIIAGHFLEGLYTRDKSYQPIPMLAEGQDRPEDGGAQRDAGQRCRGESVGHGLCLLWCVRVAIRRAVTRAGPRAPSRPPGGSNRGWSRGAAA